MKVGLIGAGNMARALARGWGDPVLVCDSGSGRARSLAQEFGGEAVSSCVEVAERAELVVLCHKPYQLDQVADQIAGGARAVASVLGATSTRSLQDAYPGVPVYALMPNTPVQLRQGIVVHAQPEPGATDVEDPQLQERVLALFARLGEVVSVPERLIGVATALSGVGPAYQALLAEAQIDAAVRAGLAPATAAQLVTATMSGSAALIAARGHDTLAVRREVTSPGGSTARGLAALERAGLRTAFQDALDAVVSPPGRSG